MIIGQEGLELLVGADRGPLELLVGADVIQDTLIARRSGGAIAARMKCRMSGLDS